MSDIEILDADLSEPAHQGAIMELIDDYARDPLISGHSLTAAAQRDLIPGLRNQPDAMILLARCEQRYAGIAVCFQGFSTFAAKPLMNIHDLAVMPEFRGQGIGRRLLEAVEQKARGIGCCKLTLEVLAGNRVARGLYVSTGFAAGENPQAAGEYLFLSKQL